ncbi:MAG TPA: DUF899 family protein [Ktedonobacteraceae bacterium]|nr:DUF899 family protein [Ktedonobacteraceae bacterium]
MNTRDQHHFTKDLDTAALPAVVDRATWQTELDKLRVREKAHTREGDAIAAARRRLPMVEVDPTIQLLGPRGPVTLLSVFEGRRLLIVYFHMWHTGQPAMSNTDVVVTCSAASNSQWSCLVEVACWESTLREHSRPVRVVERREGCMK